MSMRVVITCSNVQSIGDGKAAREKAMIVKTSVKAGMKEVISTHIGGG